MIRRDITHAHLWIFIHMGFYRRLKVKTVDYKFSSLKTLGAASTQLEKRGLISCPQIITQPTKIFIVLYYAYSLNCVNEGLVV